MKKVMKLVALLLVSALLFAAAGCQSGNTPSSSTEAASSEAPAPAVSGDDNAQEPAEVSGDAFGNVIKYDPAQPVNGGEDIEIELWYWTGAANLFQSLADEYMAVNSNVTIKLVENPWDDYWTKLPLTLQGSGGPALFNVHNSHHENLIVYMAPYDIPLADLEQEFTGVGAHVIDGNVYYLDYGIMTGSVYYNTDMWAAAGLTDADIPTTWDEFREVAKKLTVKDGDNFVQAGFNFNDSLRNFVIGLNYQWGENLFNEDGTANYNNDATVEIVQMFMDMYNVDDVGSVNFGNDSGMSFGQGQTAMVMAWGNFTNSLGNDYPDVNFDVFEIPTPTNSIPYAYNRYNGESTFGVNKNASPEEQEVAQDIIRFFLANDGLQKEFNLAMSTFPAKTTLVNDPDLMQIPAIACLADHIERYIWPGPMPATIESNSQIAMQNIFNNGMDIATALGQAEDEMNNELLFADFEPVENLYKFASEK